MGNWFLGGLLLVLWLLLAFHPERW